MIDDEGKNLGELSLSDALSLAESKDLDLIEVSNKDGVIITKIESWSKLRYKESKKKKESKGKSTELKEMWFKVFISEGDLTHKLKKVEEFLKKRHPVKITIKAKGRVGQDIIYDLLNKIVVRLEPFGDKQGDPKFQSRNLGIIIKPK
ncbi:translation initiation factor IF-3 [Candidatus Dojkabacteria bacterium]|nr:translation initiation factor IF-3 [Candidatus Dojkabacteria bacterium]